MTNECRSVDHRKEPYVPINGSFDVALYVDHLREIAEIWNFAFDEFNLPIEATVGVISRLDLADQKELVIGKPHCVNFIHGENRGVLHDTQIRTACDVISQQMGYPGRNFNIIGPTQVGKTGSLHACFVGAIIRYLTSGRITQYFYLLPNKKSLEEQTKREREIFFDLYDTHIKFGRRDGGQGYSLSGYRELTRDPNSYVIDLSWGMKRKTPSKKQLEDFHARYQAARDAGHYIQVFHDEHHYGHHPTGNGEAVVTRFLGPYEDDIENRSDVSELGCSATPYPSAEVFHTIRHYLAEGYHGYNFYRGEPIDPSVTCTTPRVMSFEDAALMTGLPLQFFSRRALNTENGFLALRRRVEKKGDELPVDDWAEYQEWFLDQLFQLINWCLIYDNPLNGQGLCLRLINNNDRMSELLKAVQEGEHECFCDPDIDIIPYFGEMGQGAIKDVLAARGHPSPDKKFLLVVTAGARMADSIPKECAYFIETADNITTHSAEVQGLIGRSCGHGKNSLVFTSTKVAESMKIFVQSQGLYHKTVIGGTTQLKGGGRIGAPRRSIVVPRDIDDPVVQAIFQELDTMLEGERATRLENGPTKTNKLGIRAPLGKPQKDFFGSIFTDQRLEHLESVLPEKLSAYYPFGFRLLRFLQETTDEKPKMYDPRFVVGLRLLAEDRVPDATHGQRGRPKAKYEQSKILQYVKPVRFLPGGEARHSSKEAEWHQPQIHLSYNKRSLKVAPKAVGLLLLEPAQAYSSPTDAVFPNKRSRYAPHLTAHQKGERDEIKRKAK